MIDTDKYEGHTPGPWKLSKNHGTDASLDGYDWLIDGVASIECGYRLPNENMEQIATNAQLIADAPLLLAEVKRLRKQVQAAHEWVQDYFDTPVRGLGGSVFADWIEYMKWEGNGGLKE